MLSAAVFTVLAAGPAVSSAAMTPATTVVLNSQRLFSAREARPRALIRAAYKRALRNANKLNKPDPLKVTPELLALYWELNPPKSMPPTERGRMRRALRGRLEIMRGKLVRMRNQERLRNRRSRKPASAPGGGVAARANQLIDLIQNTIAPESWAINGGLGTISFYGSPLYVLVVRNTSEIHRQLGGR